MVPEALAAVTRGRVRRIAERAFWDGLGERLGDLQQGQASVASGLAPGPILHMYFPGLNASGLSHKHIASGLLQASPPNYPAHHGHGRAAAAPNILHTTAMAGSADCPFLYVAGAGPLSLDPVCSDSAAALLLHAALRPAAAVSVAALLLTALLRCC